MSRFVAGASTAARAIFSLSLQPTPAPRFAPNTVLNCGVSRCHPPLPACAAPLIPTQRPKRGDRTFRAKSGGDQPKSHLQQGFAAFGHSYEQRYCNSLIRNGFCGQAVSFFTKGTITATSVELLLKGLSDSSAARSSALAGDIPPSRILSRATTQYPPCAGCTGVSGFVALVLHRGVPDEDYDRRYASPPQQPQDALPPVLWLHALVRFEKA